MNNEYEIIAELTIGHKRRRLDEICYLRRTSAIDNTNLLPLLTESSKLLKEISEFMDTYIANVSSSIDMEL